jgi:hypothetical protein
MECDQLVDKLKHDIKERQKITKHARNDNYDEMMILLHSFLVIFSTLYDIH